MYRLQPAINPEAYRRQFADFLDRLATVAVDGDEWSSFVVTHYADEVVEERRRSTVRLAIGQMPFAIDSEAGRTLLRDWANTLRASLD